MKIPNECILHNIIYYQSKIPSDIIQSYNNILIQDFVKRNNKSLQSSLEELFYYITKFPFYLITKIINAVESKLPQNQILTLSNILFFISDLFCENQITFRLNCLFNIFDFDSNGVIDLDDIFFLFQNMYMILHNSSQGLSLLKEIIYSSSKRKTLTKEIFINEVFHENSDLFYLFFLLCHEENIYSKEYLDIFIKYNYSDIKLNEIKENVFPPSKNLIKFSEKFLELPHLLENNISTCSEDEDEDFEKELSVLNDFEEHFQNCFSEYVYRNSKNKKGVSASCMAIPNINKTNNLSKFGLSDSPSTNKGDNTPIQITNTTLINNVKNNNNNDNKNNNIGSTTSGLPQIRMSCNTIQHIKKNNLIPQEDVQNDFDVKPSSSKFDLEKGYAELKIRKLYKNVLEKAKIIISNKMIFVLCKSKLNKESKTSSFKKIVSLYYLNNYYISYEGILNDKTHNNKIYHKITFRSNINQHLRTVTFFSAKHTKINNLFNFITTKTSFRDIREHYNFTSKINHGAFGTLYLSKNISTNRVSAVKQISKAIPHNSAIWEKEIFHILQVNPFDHIILCLDIFESLSNIYFVYEYLPYGTLRDFMKDNTKEKKVHYKENFILQLLTAVNHLNSFGIIHRDIKPDNLMITFNKGIYAVKLIDFGLGKIIGPQEKTNESYGSLAYSAPEVVLAEDYGFEPDVWSIGMVVYYLVYKIDPYSDLVVEREQIQEMLLKNNVFSIIMNKKKIEEDFLISIIRYCLSKGKRIKITDIINKFIENFNLNKQ